MSLKNKIKMITLKKITLGTILLLSPFTVGATNSAFEVPMNFERLSSDFISTPTQTISGDSAPASWGGPAINSTIGNDKVIITGNRNGNIDFDKGSNELVIGKNMYGGFSSTANTNAKIYIGTNLSGKSTFLSGSVTLDVNGTLGNEASFVGPKTDLFVNGSTSSKITVTGGTSNIFIGGTAQNTLTLSPGNDTVYITNGASSTINMGNGTNYLQIGGNASSTLTLGSGNDTLIIKGNVSSSVKLNAGNDNVFIGGTISNTIDGGTGINSIELGNYTLAEYQASPTLRNRIKNFTNIRFKDKKFIGDEMVFLTESEKATICVLVTTTGTPMTQVVPKYTLESRLTGGNYIGQCQTDVIGKWYSNSFFGGIGEKISDNQSLIGTGYYSNLAKNTYGEMLNSTRVSLNKGKYEISYRVKINNNTLSEVALNLGAISLTDSQAGSIKEFYAKDFSASNSYETKKLTFEVRKDQSTFSPYVFVGGKNDVWIDEVTIKRLNTTGTPMVDNSQNYVFEDKDFTLGVGKTIVDDNAQNGSAITSNGKEGFLFFGPYSTLQLPGTHKAVFRLKSPDVTSAKIIARIEVFNTDGDGTNVVSYIRGMDFKQANVYQDFELIYNRTNTGKIEYRIFYYNLGNITFDNVTDYGPIGDTTAIELRDFAVSNNTLEKKISLSFTSNKKLKNPPVVKIGTQSQATFLRVFENTYSYEMTYTDNMFGTAQITANTVQDLFGNTLETVSLGTVEFKDTKAPNITNIQVSHEVAKSFDTVSVSFVVDEELLTQPIVKIGTQKATFVEKVSGVYTYVYTVNEISETPTQKQEIISIQVMDESGNIKTDTSASVTLDINNSALVFESEELPANVGQINNSSGILHRTAQKFSTPGYLQFGPYTNKITQNTFQTAKFRLKTNDNTNSEVLATIDVLNPNGSGQRVLKQVRGTDFASSNTWQEFDLDFFRTNDGVIEFRIYATGKGEISSDRVMVVPYVGANSITYESENLYGVIGDYVTDSSASGNKAIKATLGTDKPGTFQFGPYTTPLYAKSSYTANFRLKIEDNSSTQYVALIDVYDEESGYREYKELKASDFDQANVWQDFDISFIKPTTKNIEFRIFFYGTKTLYADKVDIIEVVKPKLPDYESENLPGLTGLDIVDMDASGKMARTARVGTDLAGVVQFGPYDATNMVDGQAYKVKFRLKTPSNTTTQYIGLIDAFNGDSDFRKYIELRGVDFNQANTYQDFEINFVKPVGKNMEYRLFFYGIQDITIDKIWIEEGVYEGLPIYESERLPSKAGKIIVHQDASGGKGLYFDRNLFAPEWIQFGPYKMENVNVGENYKANFVLSTKNNSNTNVIAIINVFNIEKGIDYRVPIRGTDFSANDTFQTFSIDFNMIDKEFMEFRVFATGEDNLMTDKVYISK